QSNIKVGMIAELTGPLSFMGVADANVAKMVVDEFNAGGGLLGRKLELRLEVRTECRFGVRLGQVRRCAGFSLSRRELNSLGHRKRTALSKMANCSRSRRIAASIGRTIGAAELQPRSKGRPRIVPGNNLKVLGKATNRATVLP